MKYYSRSPEELRERFEEAKKRERKRNRSIRLFFILNLLLVIFVFGILQYRLRYEKELKKPNTKEIFFGSYHLRTLCDVSHCQVEILPVNGKKNLVQKPNFLLFSHRLSSLEKKTMVALSPEVFGKYFYPYPESLGKEGQIKLSLLSWEQKELVTFEISP